MQNETIAGRRAPAIIATLCACLAALALAMPVRAEGERTVGDLSRIQSETIILKAKVAQASAQAELDSKKRVSGAPGDDTDAPVVGNVYGHGGKWIAEFLYGNGVKIDGRAGDTIVGGFKVVSVQLEEVILSKGGRTFRVGFSARPPTQSQTGMSGVNMTPPTPIIR